MDMMAGLIFMEISISVKKGLVFQHLAGVVYKILMSVANESRALKYLRNWYFKTISNKYSIN